MRLWLRKMLLSVTASMGILAIANTETIYQETRHPSGVETPYFAQILKSRSPKPEVQPSSPTLAEDLKDSFAKDEINEQTPFANLAAFPPLEQIFAQGVRRFDRQTLRSPIYKGETGYDRIVYKIESEKGEISYIVQAAHEDQVETLILSGGQATSYLDSDCISQIAVTNDQVPLKLAERIGSSVPFLSVSR